MRRKFAVALDSCTKEQSESLINYIKTNGLGWWHWIDNFWLLTDQSGKLRAKDIRDALGDIMPGVHLIVLEIDKTGDSWSGFGPNNEKKNMFNWLKNTWDKKLD